MEGMISQMRLRIDAKKKKIEQVSTKITDDLVWETKEELWTWT